MMILEQVYNNNFKKWLLVEILKDKRQHTGKARFENLESQVV